MDFKQKTIDNNNETRYHIENLKIVRQFSKELILEMKSLVKSIVLFGSNTQNTLNKNSDIDLMIILDNISVFVSDELREAYRVITNNLTQKISSKLHIMTVNFSDFWDMSRKGDPVLINILRYGVPIYDTNLVEPMQYLLEIGKIKPSRETVTNYMSRAETLLEETTKHLENATLDLYYATLDIIHSALILEKQMPPSPKEMPKLYKETFKNTPLKQYSKTIEELYETAKDIEHKNTITITGKQYDELKFKTEEIINAIKEHNNEKLNEKDIFEF